MITQELLCILCCPESHQSLEPSDASLIERINLQIVAGAVRNRAGDLVRETIDGGLVRADKTLLYPVRRDIPILLIGEGIPLDPAGA